MINIVLAAALTAGSAASAPEPGAAQPTKDALVCHNEVVAGSRLPKRLCLHRSEADQVRRDGRDTLERVQRFGAMSGGGAHGN